MKITLASLSQRATPGNSLSLPVEDYHHYRELSLLMSREMDPNDPRHKFVPTSFYRAYCLDGRSEGDRGGSANVTQRRSSFGYPASIFRVTSTTRTSDGNLYCMRRFDSVRGVSHKVCQAVMHQWGVNFTSAISSGKEGFDHPGIVRWYKVRKKRP